MFDLIDSCSSSLYLSFSVRLESCIICNNAKISERAQLKECEVGANFTVPKDRMLLSA